MRREMVRSYRLIGDGGGAELKRKHPEEANTCIQWETDLTGE